MKLIPIYYNKEWMNKIADWRNENKKHLRTFHDTSYLSQQAWCEKVVNSLNDHYYFILKDFRDTTQDELLGYCGLDKIISANGTAEISLLVGTEYQKKSIGQKVVGQLLDKAFGEFNINLVFAETYFNFEFWERCGFKLEAKLRKRKYFHNKYYDSMIFSITKEEFYDNS